MEEIYTLLTERARKLRDSHHMQQRRRRRLLIVLAGPPGSGKSTVAAEVVRKLNKESNERRAIVLPMDGFHLTRATLEAMPNREEAIARRGAQWTFDSQGVVELIRRLHETREQFTLIHRAPAFDHEAKDPVVGAIEINTDADLIIAEGNWLLLDEFPWSQIAGFADDTWFVDVDRDLALKRVAQRHLKSGIEHTWERALYRAEHNDMINGDLVRGKLIPPAIAVKSVEDPNSYT